MACNADVLLKAEYLLAEGPVWHSARNSFFWVDIEGKTLQEYHWPTKKVTTWPLPQRTGFVVPAADAHILIAGMQGYIAAIDLTTGAVTPLLHMEQDQPDNRCNDGKCDPQGRLWFGTMHIDCLEKRGSFYCLDADGRLHKKLSNLSISNGLAWSLDGQRLYHIDSPDYWVQCYAFDAERAAITFEKTAIFIPEENGMPDGMTIDEEGMLWIAHWGGFAVSRWNPLTGAMLEKIELPVPQVTACTFGGPHMDDLIITTAATGLSKAEKEQYPLSGSLFIAKPGVKGLVPYAYAGNYGKAYAKI